MAILGGGVGWFHQFLSTYFQVEYLQSNSKEMNACMVLGLSLMHVADMKI
jgi:hypothetical protein